MTKAFTHKIVLKMALVLLLSLLGSQHLHARVKNYQYDGDLPFVQMMLDMMVAMGILDRVPVNGIYGGRYGSPNSRFGAPWSGIGPNNRNLWGNRGWNNIGRNNAGWNNNAWRNFGGQNLGLQNLNQNYTNWGQPRWGVLPEESYSLNNYPLSGSQMRPPVWSSSDLSGWVNEPWEMSVWNSEKQTKTTAKPIPEQTPATKHEDGQDVSNPDAANTSTNINTAVELKQKACVTDFCGLQVPSLNGLWVSQEGEMLGIKNTNFLWSDGRSRHLSGTIKANKNYLLISADGYQQLMYFKYKLDGNYLLTMQPDGKTREFKRTFYELSDSDGYSTYVPSYNETVIQNDVGAY